MNIPTNGIRAGVRIPVELPVLLQWKNRAGGLRAVRGKTENISGNGLFIVAPVRLRHDTQIKFTVELPSDITRIPLELHCLGRVVRQPMARPTPGIGAIIDQYEFRPAGREV